MFINSTGSQAKVNGVDARSTKSQVSQSSADTDKSSRVASIPMYGTADLAVAGSSLK